MSALTLNFARPSDKDPALKAFARKLGQAGAVVFARSVSTTTAKKAGMEYRTASLSFTDNQTVELLFKSSGDVFEVRLNGKAIPVTSQTDAGKAAKEIADRLAAGRAKFQAELTKTTTAPVAAARISRTSQLKQLTARRDALQIEIEAVQAELAALTSSPP